MDIIKDVRLNDKEILLKDEYYTLPQHKNRTRKSIWVTIFYVGILVTVIVACVVSCICAAYCHKSLAEIKKLQHLDDGENVVPEESKELPIASNSEYDDESDFDETSGYDYEMLLDNTDDKDDVDDHAEEGTIAVDNGADVSDDEDVEGSGVDFEESDDYDLVRKRRDILQSQSKDRRKKGKTSEGGRKSKKGKKSNKMMNLQAAHFEVKFSDKNVQDLVQVEHSSYIKKETCRNVDKLDGQLCLNRTYYPEKNVIPLTIFKPSSWVVDKKSPVKFVNSIVKAKSNGIYLVYAQAYIGGKEPEKAIIVVQKRYGKEVNAFSCRTGVHPDHYDSVSGQLQTCSVLGLMNLKMGDNIEIHKSNAAEQIILDKDKTYFGVVQLSGFALPKNKKSKN